MNELSIIQESRPSDFQLVEANRARHERRDQTGSCRNTRVDVQSVEMGRRGSDGPLMWNDDSEEQGGTIEEIQDATSFWLTEKGKVTVKRLIREAERKNLEWWVKIVGSIVAAITGLLGALIGLVAILKK